MINDITLEITITKWDKYNPKRAQKSYPWLRLNNDILNSQGLFGFSTCERLLWIALLCECSKKNGAPISITVPWIASGVAALHRDVVNGLEKLKNKGMISIAGYETVLSLLDHCESPRSLHRDVVSVTSRDDLLPLRTDGRDETDETDVAIAHGLSPTTPRPVFDFGEAPKKPRAKKEPSPISAIWEAYAEVYQERYNTPPVRNAKLNGQLSQFAKRVPIEEAPEIAAFYLRHNAPRYSLAGHPIGLLLLDAEKLRTEWITGKRITTGDAKARERVDAFRQQMRQIDEETSDEQSS